MKALLLAVTLPLLATACLAQNSEQPQPTTKTRAAPKQEPTLGFSHVKDVSPIIDSDALAEENELKKKLPDNQFVQDKRALHEAALMHDFLEGFREAKECNGITFYMTDKKGPPQFAVQITVNFHDKPDSEQEWIWMLFDSKSKGMGGFGTQSNAKLTARDVCMTVWEDIDPNHYKKPGGRIE